MTNGRPRELKRVKLEAVLGSHPENMNSFDFRLKPLNQVENYDEANFHHPPLASAYTRRKNSQKRIKGVP
jgi:hypothetical protein